MSLKELVKDLLDKIMDYIKNIFAIVFDQEVGTTAPSEEAGSDAQGE